MRAERWARVAALLCGTSSGCGQAPVAPPPAVAPAAPPEAPAALARSPSQCEAFAALQRGAPCACGDEGTCVMACDGGSAQACAALGGCYGAGTFGSAPDAHRYARYSARACELGDSQGCLNLGDATAKGAGTPADPARAREIYAAALATNLARCDGGDADGCYLVSHAYDKGLGVAADAAQKTSYLERACRLGSGFSCLVGVVDASSRGRREDASRLAGRVCELLCVCDDFRIVLAHGSPEAARAYADFRARCAEHEAAACAAVKRIEAPPLATRISFSGNSVFTAAELDAAVTFDKLRGDEEGSRADVQARDVLALESVYYDRGYMDAKIEWPGAVRATDGPFLDVRINVREGPRYHLGKLTIAERDAHGRIVRPIGGKDLRARLSARDGDWLDRRSLVRDLAAIKTLYADAGYASVAAEPKTSAHLESAVVDIDVAVARGERAHLVKLVVRGNHQVASEDILRSLGALGVKDGELYNETKLTSAKARLTALGLKKVDFAIEPNPDAAHLTLIVGVEE